MVQNLQMETNQPRHPSCGIYSCANTAANKKKKNKTRSKAHRIDKYTAASQQDVWDVGVENVVGRVALSTPSTVLGNLIFYWLIDLVSGFLTNWWVVLRNTFYGTDMLHVETRQAAKKQTIRNSDANLTTILAKLGNFSPWRLLYFPEATSVKSSDFSLGYWRLCWNFGGRRECTYRSSAVPADKALRSYQAVKGRHKIACCAIVSSCFGSRAEKKPAPLPN